MRYAGVDLSRLNARELCSFLTAIAQEKALSVKGRFTSIARAFARQAEESGCLSEFVRELASASEVSIVTPYAIYRIYSLLSEVSKPNTVCMPAGTFARQASC
jgi:hypothetical protein